VSGAGADDGARGARAGTGGEGEPGRGPQAELLEIACAQARGAGELLLEKYRAGVEEGVRSKSTSTDLVSDADLQAERCIREGIERARPDDGMVGEEGDDETGTSGLKWVVDPLDGTVNYLFGIPHWCVSVAVLADRRSPGSPIGKAGVTLAGAVYDPLREELFAAVRGAGAVTAGTAETAVAPGGHAPAPSSAAPTLNGEPMVASKCDELAQAMVATGFNYDAKVRERQGEVFARLIGRVRDIRRFGAAALDLAWTAAGRYDAFYERGVNVWDVAAGVLMCERAGLQTRELPARDGLPWGVLAAPPALVDELMELVGG